MRPNQQNNNKNRSRGRNNNGGRRHVNPLSRNYESNGPDVKVRGNAAHVAEKYLQLARDAQSSGDSVMAENYLQHAEHYFRLLASAQVQNQPRDQFGQPTGDEDFDDDFPPINDRFSSPEPRQPFQPQPQGQPHQNHNQHQGDAPQQQSEPQAESSEPQEIAVEGEAPASTEAGEPRRHRERRPRRRSRGQGEGGVDPANAPQPEVDLPSFITAGNTPAE
jgi:hypothetical protein